MANKLYDSKGQLIGYIATVTFDKNLSDGLTRVVLHTGHELTFRPGDLIADRGGNWRIAMEGSIRVRRALLLRTPLLSRMLSLLLRPRSFTGRMVPRPL